MSNDKKSPGIVQRDSLKVLNFLNSGALECRREGQIVVMMIGVCSAAFLCNKLNTDADRAQLKRLFGELVDGFEPNETVKG